MQTETVEYKLRFDKFGLPRRYALSKKRRLNIIDNNSWIEADTKNQWYYKDYRSFYIVISEFKEKEFTVSCSGYSLKRKFNNLNNAKLASLKFCDKISM
jgi:hypothetical protein